MPGLYNSTQVRYFKQIEDRENQRRDRKQTYLEQIRNRAYEKVHAEVGERKPTCGKKIFKDAEIDAGVKSKQEAAPIKDILFNW